MTNTPKKPILIAFEQILQSDLISSYPPDSRGLLMVDSLKVGSLSVWRPLTVGQSKSCSRHGVCKDGRCLEMRRRYLVDYLNVKLCRAQAVQLLERIELLLALLRGLVSMIKGRKLPFLLKRMIARHFRS
jgi:hypothetical protein